MAISPSKVALDRGLLFFMAAEVGVVQSKFPQSGELGFNPIEPGSVGGGQVKLYAVRFRPLPDFRGQMRTVVIHDDVQRFRLAIATPEPLQKPQKLDRGLAEVELAE